MEAHVANAEAESHNPLSPVNSHKEWDPLEEVIVGRLEGAMGAQLRPAVRTSSRRTNQATGGIGVVSVGWMNSPRCRSLQRKTA
jgi:hypothetical protein